MSDFKSSSETRAGFLPFYNAALKVASRIKQLEVAKELNGAVYLYRKEDNPNISLPCVCVYPGYIETSQSGFYWEGVITIDIYRNSSTSNRNQSYTFLSVLSETIVQAIAMSNDFYFRELSRGRDYITQFGTQWDNDFIQDDPSFNRINIMMQIYYPQYLRWASSVGFEYNNLDTYVSYFKLRDLKFNYTMVSEEDLEKVKSTEEMIGMIGKNELASNEVGIDISGTDEMIRKITEQVPVKKVGNESVVVTTLQAISINGALDVRDKDTGDTIKEIRSPSIGRLGNEIDLRDETIPEDSIVWISYNY